MQIISFLFLFFSDLSEVIPDPRPVPGSHAGLELIVRYLLVRGFVSTSSRTKNIRELPLSSLPPSLFPSSKAEIPNFIPRISLILDGLNDAGCAALSCHLGGCIASCLSRNPQQLGKRETVQQTYFLPSLKLSSNNFGQSLRLLAKFACNFLYGAVVIVLYADRGFWVYKSPALPSGELSFFRSFSFIE